MNTSALSVSRAVRARVLVALRGVFVAGLSAATMAHAAGADSGDDLKATPYRPTVSNPADLPVPRHVEVEAGGLSVRNPGDGRENSIPYLLKYALNEDFGVLVGGESFVSDRSGGDTARGWGDTSVVMKFHRALTQSTALGLEAGARLPTASSDLGSGHTDFTLNGIVSTEVSDCDVDINVSYTRLDIADAGTARDVLGWAVAASRNLSAKWGLAGELSGAGQHGTPGQSQFLGALSYAAASTLVFDGGALFGLNRNSPRFGLFAGLTFLIR